MAKIKSARANLIEALQKATFSTAHFCLSGPHNDDQDRMIKKETLLYRQSWLIPPIMEALRDIDPCDDCKGRCGKFLGVTFMDCPKCGGTGIKDGLPFDPWELSRKAAEKE